MPITALVVNYYGELMERRRANAMLGGATPLACLNAGQHERVLGLARAVGIA